MNIRLRRYARAFIKRYSLDPMMLRDDKYASPLEGVLGYLNECTGAKNSIRKDLYENEEFNYLEIARELLSIGNATEPPPEEVESAEDEWMTAVINGKEVLVRKRWDAEAVDARCELDAPNNLIPWAHAGRDSRWLEPMKEVLLEMKRRVLGLGADEKVAAEEFKFFFDRLVKSYACTVEIRYETDYKYDELGRTGWMIFEIGSKELVSSISFGGDLDAAKEWCRDNGYNVSAVVGEDRCDPFRPTIYKDSEWGYYIADRNSGCGDYARDNNYFGRNLKECVSYALTNGLTPECAWDSSLVYTLLNGRVALVKRSGS